VSRLATVFSTESAGVGEKRLWLQQFLQFDPAFALLHTLPAVADRRTDRHVAVAKTALCIASRGQKKFNWFFQLENSCLIRIISVSCR